MAFKVKIIGLHQCCFITLVHKECERLENEPKQEECITLVFEKVQSFTCVHCVFYNRRLLDRPRYCRSSGAKAYVYFVKLTTAARHLQAANTCEGGTQPGPQNRPMRISQVNYQQSESNETQRS